MNFRTCLVDREGDRIELQAGSIRLQLPSGEFGELANGMKVEVGLRPSKMELATPHDKNAITGTIVLVENMGSEGQVIVDVDGQEISFVTKGFRTLEPGQPVSFSIDPASIHVFSPETGRSLRKAN